MYHKVEQPPTPPENFELPCLGKLSPENRWVIMANLIPWSEFEPEYAQNFGCISYFICKKEGKCRKFPKCRKFGEGEQFGQCGNCIIIFV